MESVSDVCALTVRPTHTHHLTQAPIYFMETPLTILPTHSPIFPHPLSLFLTHTQSETH